MNFQNPEIHIYVVLKPALVILFVVGLALTTKAPPLGYSLYPREPHRYEYFPRSRLYGYEYFPGRSHVRACSQATINSLTYGALRNGTGYPLSWFTILCLGPQYCKQLRVYPVPPSQPYVNSCTQVVYNIICVLSTMQESGQFHADFGPHETHHVCRQHALRPRPMCESPLQL